MKTKKMVFLAFVAIATMTSCSSDDNGGSTTPGGGTIPGGGTELVKNYPVGSIVWGEDTTVILKDHFVVPKGSSLYIEPGAKIIAANSVVKPEIVVLGNLYSMGTEAKPITFSVPDSLKTDRFARPWGGIICGFDCKELYLNYTKMEYCGAQTTEESPSFKNGLFKTVTGEGVPAVHFCNPDGEMLIENSTFINNAEDQIYITGGKSIVANNKFISSGFDGGEAINYKSECLADICFNLVYDANTNGLKLSNKGFTNLQSDLNVYNNTIINSGWRRPKVKGGSIWLESGVLVKLYNNLVYDCRWGLKHLTSDVEDPASVITPNYYYASTSVGVEQMKANEDAGILNGANDLFSTFPNDKNPLFAAYIQQSNVNINVCANEGDIPQIWNDAWDFHLSANSPALTGGQTTISRHFSTEGLVFVGLSGIISNNVFLSPAPQTYFGAYGKK